jgi:hypothetical protein
MRRGIVGALAVLALMAAPARGDVPASLRGSNAAMARQHGVAVTAGYAFARTAAEIAALERTGALVRLHGNDDYGFREGVQSMVGRPEMQIFIERLARDYRAACGEPLIVTSMTRPLNRQPRNAHPLSVHPAGIAVDLRVSQDARCRGWLEETLLAMEDQGLLDGIRERNPPHYHVALFPDAYMAHVAPLMEAEWSAQRAHYMARRLAVLAAGPVAAPRADVRRSLRSLFDARALRAIRFSTVGATTLLFDVCGKRFGFNIEERARRAKRRKARAEGAASKSERSERRTSARRRPSTAHLLAED